MTEAPMNAMLRSLAIALTATSVTILAVSVALGRLLCRRALRPIDEMANSARSIRYQPERAQMLKVPATGDELEDLGNAFNSLLRNLHESLERQSRFAGDASHQLRTPLTAMLTSVDVSLRHDRTVDEYKRVLDVVRRRGGHLQQIIESLLFLARADETMSLDPIEQIDLVEWCRAWLDGWKEHARVNDIAFYGETQSITIQTHPGLLGQVLDNLLDNACKYSEADTPIDVTIDALPQGAQLSVRDRGRGIEIDKQLLIFEPFYRTNQANWQGTVGTGLGLAVVQRLAGILRANVDVISEPGKGSCFRVLLPIDDESPCSSLQHRQQGSSMQAI
jgi:signal transduction histidine kinase